MYVDNMTGHVAYVVVYRTCFFIHQLLGISCSYQSNSDYICAIYCPPLLASPSMKSIQLKEVAISGGEILGKEVDPRGDVDVQVQHSDDVDKQRLMWEAVEEERQVWDGIHEQQN
jgi:hypothetical protein